MHRSIWCLALVIFLILPAPSMALPVPDDDNGAIQLPPGFRALVVADNLGEMRFMAVAPNGDIYLKRTGS